MDSAGRGGAKVLPTPAGACCLGRTRSGSPKSAASSLLRARRRSRSPPGLRASRRRRRRRGLGQRARRRGPLRRRHRPVGPAAARGRLGGPGRSSAGHGPDLCLAEHGRGGGDRRGRGDGGAGPGDPTRADRRPGRRAGGLRRLVRPPFGPGRRWAGDPGHGGRTDRLSVRVGEPGVRGPHCGGRDADRAPGPRRTPDRLREPTWRPCWRTGTQAA